MRKLINLKRWFEYLARETTWNRLSQLAIADVERLAEDLEARDRRVAALEKRVAELGGFLVQATDELHKHSILIARLCQVLPSVAPLVGTEPASPQAIASLKEQLIGPAGRGPRSLMQSPEPHKWTLFSGGGSPEAHWARVHDLEAGAVCGAELTDPYMVARTAEPICAACTAIAGITAKPVFADEPEASEGGKEIG